MVKRAKNYVVFFLIGCIGYPIIEILWRGYTHLSMLFAGGLCFCIFALVNELFKDNNLLFRALASAFGVIAVELVFGVIFNILLGMQIWDYSDLPFNVLGQVCPLFFLLWTLLALVLLPFAKIIEEKLSVLI